MNNNVKIGIIGAGRIVDWFINDIHKTNHNFEIIGIWNRTFEKAEEKAKKYNISNVYMNIDDLLNNDEITITYIATNDSTHFEYSKKSLLAGKSVISEKPITLSHKEAVELYEIAEKKNLFFADAIKTPSLEAYKKLKTMLNNDEIGNYEMLSGGMVKISESGNVFNLKKDDAFQTQIWSMTYDLFVAIDLFGKVKEANISYTTFENGSPKNITISLIHENNKISNLIKSASLSSNVAMQIMGENGYITLGGDSKNFTTPYHKDTFHAPITVTKFDTINNKEDRFVFDFETEGEGLNVELDNIINDYINGEKNYMLNNKNISLEIIRVLELIDNIVKDKISTL